MFAFYAPVIYLGAVNAWAGVVVKDLFAQVGDRRGLKLASTPSPS